MQVAQLGRRCLPFPAGAALGGGEPRRKCDEDRVEVGDRLGLPADHEAEASFETEHAPAGADLDELDSALGKGVGPVDVVTVVAVAPVDDDVTRLEPGRQVVDHCADDGGGDHDPERPGRTQMRHQIVKITSSGDPVQCHELVDSGQVAVVDDAVVPIPHEAPNQVGTHPSQTHHGDLHGYLPLRCASENSVAVKYVTDPAWATPARSS